ncbi:hypothetical protein K1719_006257 [Acacia pycnantha]|nr:hypothetical protein K1719_006257 [Acacia pycnantha]
MLQEIDSDHQRGVNGETRLYEMLRSSRSQLESKGGTFPSRIVVLKPNDGKGESGLKCFSVPFGNYPLVNGMLKDFSSHESSRSFPGIKMRKNETCCRSSEILKSVSNDDPRTDTKGILHRYCGLRKDACLNSSLQESKKQHTNVKIVQHIQTIGLILRNPSLLGLILRNPSLFFLIVSVVTLKKSYVRLLKSKKKFFGDNLSEQIPKLPELSASQACLIKDEAKDSRLEQKNISKKNIASHNSSIYGQVADEKTDVVGRPFGNPYIQPSETTVCILLEDSDSSSHTSYGSIQQEESEFQEDDSVYSVCSEAKTDSLVVLSRLPKYLRVCPLSAFCL